MAAATLTTTVSNGAFTANIALLAKRIADAIVASRSRAAEQELLRHEALIRDLAPRSGRGLASLSKCEAVPTKI